MYTTDHGGSHVEMPRHVFTALAGLTFILAASAAADGVFSNAPAAVHSDGEERSLQDDLNPNRPGEPLVDAGPYGGFVTPPPAFPPGGVFTYPGTDYSSVVDTNGWPVAIQHKYFPQGAISAEGVGVYQTLLPADRPDDCFCTPPPCYFGTLYVAGVVLDRRSNLERMPLFFNGAGAERLNTGDLDLETEAGFRLGFWLSHPSGIDWNVDYFNVGNFQANETRTDPAGLTDLFFGFTDVPQTALTAEYESNLQSIELTVRARQWHRLAPLIGIRFLEVDEQFNSLTNVAGRAGWFSSADNELYGLQFGFQGLLYEHRWWRMETTCKAGPYFNDIDVDARVNPAGGAFIVKEAGFGATAFVGDVKIGLVCQMGPRVNFRIGYQALWIEGVALGPNQNNNISFASNLQTVDLSGVLYQGGELGFELSW